uniref:FUSC family protein n=1 Tax=Roseovarius sp. TaxID=1486281 RepID=UPI00356A6EFE
GEQAAIIALIVAFIMTLVTKVPLDQIANQGLLAAWKMACLPMAVMILFNLLCGVPAQTHVRRLIVWRLTCAAQSLEAGAHDPETTALLAEGNDTPRKQMQLVRALHLVPKTVSSWLSGALETSYLLMLAAPVPQAALPAARRHALATAIRDAAHAIAHGDTPGMPQVTDGPEIDRPIREALAALAGPEGGTLPEREAQPFLAPDAFSDPRHHRYAIKTSVSAVICYLIYTGLQWDGIHTALITCYVAALGTTGETVRKLTLRIIGCLIGAALGCAALIFVMPWLTSVGGLMILVFCGILIAGWVSSGSERISYGGVQIALAFLLTTLNGFGPSFEFSQAGNRVMGILLGLFVIYVIFTQFWPASISRQIRTELGDIAERLLQLAERPWHARLNDLTDGAHINMALEDIRTAINMASFEPRHQRADEAMLAKYREARCTLAALYRSIRFEPVVSEKSFEQLRRYHEASR